MEPMSRNKSFYQRYSSTITFCFKLYIHISCQLLCFLQYRWSDICDVHTFILNTKNHIISTIVGVSWKLLFYIVFFKDITIHQNISHKCFKSWWIRLEWVLFLPRVGHRFMHSTTSHSNGTWLFNEGLVCGHTSLLMFQILGP